jgi:F-box and leucine-rich repeat protein 7
VRVTGTGVEAVVEGCTVLEVFDVSQCKNLARWLEQGGEERSRKRWTRDGGGVALRFVTEKVSGEGGGLR